MVVVAMGAVTKKSMMRGDHAEHLPFGKEVEARGKQQAGDAERCGDAGCVHARQNVGQAQHAHGANEQKQRSDRGQGNYDQVHRR